MTRRNHRFSRQGLCLLVLAAVAVSPLAGRGVQAQECFLKLDFAMGTLPKDARLDVFDGNRIEFVDRAMKTTARTHTYAHLEIPLTADNIAASCEIKLLDEGAGVSWCPSLFLYWHEKAWCGIGLAGEDVSVHCSG